MEELQEEFDDTDSEGESESIVSFEQLVEPKRQLDAELEFLRSVKLAIGSNSKKYGEFVQSFKDHYHQSAHIDNEVQSKIKLLFREHPQLVADFNTFLSAEHHISVLVQRLSYVVRYDVAITFLRKVEAEYIHDKRRYWSLVKIINKYWTGRENITETCKEVGTLLHDKPDLIAEFFSVFNEKAVYQARPNRLFAKLKSSCIPALLHLAVLGLGISIGFYLA